MHVYCTPSPQAFHLGIRYPTHLLLTFQWYDERWWLEDNDVSDVNLTCSGEERESVLRYSLAFNFILVDLLNDKNITTNVGMIIVRCGPHHLCV